jgi:hypothetical protein
MTTARPRKKRQCTSALATGAQVDSTTNSRSPKNGARTGTRCMLDRPVREFRGVDPGRQAGTRGGRGRPRTTSG